jgi:hypothetical protein
VEVLIALSLVLAGIVGGVGLIVVYRRRNAARGRLRSEELRALDQRIATRIAGLRDGAESASVPLSPRSDDDLADLARPIPALLPLESGTSLTSRLGLRRPSHRGVESAERSTALRDTAVVLGVGVVLLLVASQFLPASTPPPTATATPTASNLIAQLPTGTTNLLLPTATPGPTASETATPTVDITFEPTPTPKPTATPYHPYVPPPPAPTPNPTVNPTCSVLSITLSPDGAGITYGGSQAYSTTAHNSCGQNFIVTSLTTYTIGGVACVGNVCTPSHAGASQVVAGSYGGKSDTALLNVAKATATLSLSGLAQTYDGGTHPVTVTTSPAGLSGVSVTYDGSGTAPTNAGSYAVVASLTNTNYTATNASGTLVISPANQTITFDPIPGPMLTTDPPFTVTAAASSGLSVTFTSDTLSVCTVSGNTVTLTGSAGTCTVRASQGGNSNYNPATDQTQSVTVN